MDVTAIETAASAADGARAPRRTGRRARRPPAARLRRRRRSPTPRPTSRSAALAKGLVAAGAGKGTHVGPPAPERLGLRRGLAGGRSHRRGDAPAQHVLDQRRAAAPCCATPTWSCCSPTPDRTAGGTYVDVVGDAVRRLDPSAAPPLSLARGRRPCAGSCSTRRRSSSATVRPSTTSCSPRSRPPCGRPTGMVIVHTSGSTSAPKGVIHQHGPLIRHLDNLNELRRYTADEVLFSNSPFFWIGGFAYSLLGTLLAGATLVCSNATDAGATRSTCSSGRGRRWSTASPPRSPTSPRTRRSPTATCRRSVAATCGRSCRPASARPIPSCATTCWA